jgi:small subunit ribosomal protein S16
MLVIRLQRTGRKGHAMFRIVVQDSRRTPTSGKVVAWLGSYDPHAKNLTVDKDKANFYLEHGAQPSPRMAKLLQADGLKLPKWVSLEAKLTRNVKNPDKRRSTRPEQVAEPQDNSEAATEQVTEATEVDQPEHDSKTASTETTEA